MVRLSALLMAAAAATVFCVAGGAPHALAAAPSPQGGIVPQPVGCKKIVSGTCTSCSIPSTADDECKSGQDFKTCSTTHVTCDNGAQCDTATGGAACN